MAKSDNTRFRGNNTHFAIYSSHLDRYNAPNSAYNSFSTWRQVIPTFPVFAGNPLERPGFSRFSLSLDISGQ